MKNFILSFLIIISANFNFSQDNIVSFMEEPDICEGQCMGGIYFEAIGTGTLHSSIGMGTFWEDSSDISGELQLYYTGLCPGLYTLTIYDDIDTIQMPFMIESWSPFLWVDLIGTDASCIGNCDGSIEPIVNGGIPPYFFTWSDGSTNASNSNLCPGTYNLLVTDQFGCIVTNSLTISGSAPASDFAIYNDINQNCIREAEHGIPNIPVLIEPGNIIQSTDSCGSIQLPFADGIYTATIDTANLNWSTNCPISQTFEIINQNTTTDVSFGLFADYPCPDPDVSIFMPFMRPCFSDQIIHVMISNSNTATGVLSDFFVDVELDPLFILDNASMPYTGLGNNVFQFQLDSLNPGESITINLSTTLSCNAFLGQTLCMEANLNSYDPCVLDQIISDPVVDDGTVGVLEGLPVPCMLPWDQSSLSVQGWCENDSIYFEISNTGEFGQGDMQCYAPIWITVDGIVTYTDSIMIQGGESSLFSYYGNGQTWIFNVEQHPLHPGNSHPNAHVEACGDLSNWTPNLINDFPLDDADPIIDIYCGIVTGSYDPNDKTGYPIGQTTQNYIQPNQQIQYLVRFQNTGTDTAFTVVIRDTLDMDLNIFSVTPGVASHPYTFKMYGPRVLEWTFENILLPDSSANLVESNGFMTFHVDQNFNLPAGTLIENDADIYFDFNPPIITNETVHQIFEGFVEVENPTVSSSDLYGDNQVSIFPNPAKNYIILEMDDFKSNIYEVFDLQGRRVLSGMLVSNQTNISISKLSKGTYTIGIQGQENKVVFVKE